MIVTANLKTLMTKTALYYTKTFRTLETLALVNQFNDISSSPDDINSDDPENMFHLNTMILRNFRI